MDDPDEVNYFVRLREIFEEASSLPVEEREDFLKEACGQDRKLRLHLTNLLRESELRDPIFEPLWKNSAWKILELLMENPDELKELLEDYVDSKTQGEDSLVGKKVGHFEVIAPIGRGSMGMVYQARDEALDRLVALKFLPSSLVFNESAKERFILEAKTASALDHPNIATIYEIGETPDNRLFIAMAYYPGETLQDLINKPRFEVEEILGYGCQLASALSEAHKNGIVHGDVKPGNIFVGEDGRIRLLDFGLASLVGSAEFGKKGFLSGTLPYMSPEQVRGEPTDVRSDVWSVGVVLFEILTGKWPFVGKTAQDVIQAIQNEKPVEMVNHDRCTSIKVGKLQRIIGKCLQKDPATRYQSVGELLKDLQKLKDKKFRKIVLKGIYWSVAIAALAVGALSLYYNFTLFWDLPSGYIKIVDDPFLRGQGKVLMVHPGNLGKTIHRVVADLPIPEIACIGNSVMETSESTFYFKVGRPIVDGKPGEVDIVWGLASEAERHHEEIFHYIDLSVCGRYSSSGIMDVIDRNTYKPIYDSPLDTALWYELWFVINHNNNRFDLFIRGGNQFPVITQVASGAQYRLMTSEKIDHLVLITTTGSISTIPKGIHPAYFDDFYMYPRNRVLTAPDEDWICLEDFEGGNASKWKVNLTGNLSGIDQKHLTNQ